MAQQSGASLPVVLVDDETTVLLSSRMILGSAGIKDVLTLEDSRELMPLLADREMAAVVLDLFMPYIAGTQLLPQIAKAHPDLPVIVMTASQEIETAVSCMKKGAFEYLVKPVEESRFVSSVKRALELRALRRQVGALKRSLMTDRLEHEEAFSSIVTVSHFPTGNTSLGSARIPTDDDLLVAGWSMQPSVPSYRSYLLSFDHMGSPRWARRIDACDEESPSVRIESVKQRASGDIALFATEKPAPGKPNRTVFATLSPDGEVRGALAVWSGHRRENLKAVTIAELPTSGFVSMETWRRSHGNRLELSTWDSLGARTAGTGFSFTSIVKDSYPSLRPAGLRLTTDGGALVVAQVDNDEEGDLYTDGLFAAKIPARTFEAPFDPRWIKPVKSTFPNEPCSASTVPVKVEVTEVSLIDRDISAIVQLNPLTPQRDARMK